MPGINPAKNTVQTIILLRSLQQLPYYYRKLLQ
eukprot:COSAG02_NODE_1839_length_10707_cov_7.098793_12_plen_33_part_00